MPLELVSSSTSKPLGGNLTPSSLPLSASSQENSKTKTMESESKIGKGLNFTEAAPSSTANLGPTNRLSKKARQSIAEFFGVSEEDEKNAARWERRRVRMANSIGKGLKDEVPPGGDLTDGMAQIRDPLRRPTRFSIGTRPINRQSAFSSGTISSGEQRKKSVFQMTLKGIQSLSVVQSALNRDKRQLGVGKFGKFAKFSMRSSNFTKDVKQQLDNLDDHRPYFSYWVTFVQIVIFIVSVAVYGIAPIGIGTTKVSANVKMPNLAIQTETYIERDNLWIGPRQADLIHLGAKYSPCMRVDENLNEALARDRREESETACCIRNDGSGCVQTMKGGCSTILSSWDKWTVDDPGEGNRTSGTVCGQDPRFCSNPSSTPPFEWPDKITEWPICKETAKHNQSSASRTDRHMHCDVLGRPCCFGIQGECIITTPEHCNLKRGFFHSDASLCSQVNCFEEICGMIPFADSNNPDQFYRLWTSLFLHGGVVHLVISILFQMYIMRDLEKLMGAIRTCIIYIGSGVAGNLASCTFIPYQVEVGPSGAQFGIAACMVVEVIQSYQMYRRPWRPVLITLGPLLCFFVLGLLPWFDNWAHIFGFFFGFLLAFAVMPYVTFGKFDKHRKMISIIVSLGLAIGLFTILVLVFYVAPLTECNWCIYLNCIPLTADFCENMRVDLKKNTSYATYL